MSIFALVDCNNFYVSCERAFKPKLENMPVVVLSNNDGCVISRSNEAKKLGIPMGAPFFKWEAFCKQHNVAVFSSNYELYGDMSRRVMTLLQDFCPETKIYSIDEAFLTLDSFGHSDLTALVLAIRHKIKTYTGIPVSIGIAQTKTLAKIANHIAKKQTQTGVFNMCESILQEKTLAEFPIQDMWGIGYSLRKKLPQLNIKTAKQLRDTDPKFLRSLFSVTLEKTIQELRGISCISLDETQPRQQIISSRSFSFKVEHLAQLEEAVSHYTTLASHKLRQQKSAALAIHVFVQTSAFNENDTQYSNGATYPFPTPTSDTGYMISIAKKCLKNIYKSGYRYHKAGVILLDIIPLSIQQYDLLTPTSNPKTDALNKTLDNINHLMGKNTVFYCAEGIERTWKIKREKMSPRCTTHWDELPIVYCR